MSFWPCSSNPESHLSCVWKPALILACALLLLIQLHAVECHTGGNSAACSPWVATWGAAMVDAGSNAPDISGQTLRLIIHTSIGGSQKRIWLSNRFGTVPLQIGAAHIAISMVANPSANTEMSAILPASNRTLTFNRKPSVTIAPGSSIVSDAVALDVPALSDIAVSLYFPDFTLGTTVHGGAQQTSFAATGNVIDAPSLDGKSWTKGSWYILTGVDVYAPGGAAVVVLGDSITDGNHSTASENHRWPDYLAACLAANDATRKAGTLGVVNTGISGNRLLLEDHST